VQQQQATADGQVLQQTEYLYEPGSFRPMAQVTHHEQGSDLHYIVTDHAGTPQELCNEQGDIVWRGEQALWGHYHGQSQRHWQRREEAANDSIQCDLRYQGQFEDPESGLYYNVNRYYDADSGQYLSPDPIGFAGGLRPQAYVANPLEWVDPLGLVGCGSKNIAETAREAAQESKASTVWDSVKPTQGNLEGTYVPKSFELTTDDSKFWVHPNATKHMQEYLTRNGVTHSTPMNSQAMLTSFRSAVNKAVSQGYKSGEMIIVDNWEIIFGSGKSGDALPVIKHALCR